MPTAWEGSWKINKDRKGVLTGVKDLQFTLTAAGSAGGRPLYVIKHDKSGAADDPFRNNPYFIQFGRGLPSTPGTKLKPWTSAEDGLYQDLINDTFISPPASSDVQRLEGEKEVGGKKEAITLYLIPDAIGKNAGGSPYIGLILASCRVNVPPPVKRPRGKSNSGPQPMQDGTAHGNPK